MIKRLSIRTKITLWFTAALLIVVTLTFICVLSVSNQVLQKTIRDNLIETVENNIDEIEYFGALQDVPEPDDVDHFIHHGKGYLEVDDDFLDAVNQVFTALYDSSLFMLYGENPIAKQTADVPLSDMLIQTVKAGKVKYYIYDRELTGDGLDGLWLRGVVSETQGKEELSSITVLSMTILPIIVIISIFGGSVVARRALSPIQKISNTVTNIRLGNDLKKRIELDAGDDELHVLANQFNDMFERLELSFEKEKRFTSDVSHELRTPMSVIMAQCEYSMSEDGTPEEYAESIRTIYRQGQNMTALINQMLDIARLEMKPENYPKERLDISALTRSVCEDLALIKDKGIILSAEAEDGLLVSGNRGLLSRAISNLVLNAYRYGKENGHIQVSLRRDKGLVVLTVADDGIGISAKDLPKVFDRFFRADSARTDNGTGLGLSITKEIVLFHEGSISVDSRPEEGSVFSITLPAIPTSG
jgi:signal transduction histidine kinase